MKRIANIEITTTGAWVDGQQIAIEPDEGKALLTALYKQEVGDYPKFYKMDPLAKLGFLAAELLLKRIDEEHFVEREDRAIVLVNRSASRAADQKYESTIQTGDDYFPSPADFVYTLPNIVTGEIAIRHHYHGETTFLVVDQEDEALLELLVQQAFEDTMTTSALCGWLECQDENHFEARLSLVEK